MTKGRFSFFVAVAIAAVSTGLQVEWGHWGIAAGLAIGTLGMCAERIANVIQDSHK